MLGFIYNLLWTKYNITQIWCFVNLLLNAFWQCITLLKYRYKRISDKTVKLLYIFHLLHLLIVSNIGILHLNRLTILLNSFLTRHQLAVININTIFFTKYLPKYFVTIVILVLHVNQPATLIFHVAKLTVEVIECFNDWQLHIKHKFNKLNGTVVRDINLLLEEFITFIVGSVILIIYSALNLLQLLYQLTAIILTVRNTHAWYNFF